MALDKDDIKQLIAILQKGLVDDQVDTPEPQTQRKRRTNKSSNTTTEKKFVNQFDNMTESKMHKDDIEIDRKLNRLPPTQRSRNYKPLMVTCRVCGKQESLNPALVESVERHKCNKCSTSAG